MNERSDETPKFGPDFVEALSLLKVAICDPAHESSGYQWMDPIQAEGLSILNRCESQVQAYVPGPIDALPRPICQVANAIGIKSGAPPPPSWQQKFLLIYTRINR